jgi:tetratricopeptide (TPR) repeat protein
MFSFALNYHFGGLDVTGYHIVNLAIHIINAMLVYFLVILTFKTPYLSSQQSMVSSHTPPSPPFNLMGDRGLQFIPLAAALLFVSHPIQTQAVTYIVQRLTSLASMFYLLSVVLYVKARITAVKNSSINLRAVVYGLMSLLSAIAAMFTKEIAFTLPIVIAMYEFFFFKAPRKKRLILLLPFMLTLLIIPLSILGTDKPVAEMLSDVSEKTKVQTDMTRWDYLITQMRVITTYIRLLLLPINQNLDYDYPIYHSLFTASVFLSFLFLLSIFALGVYFFYRSRLTVHSSTTAGSELQTQNLRLISFGIFWFFITLSVESSIIPITDVIFEHRVYLPSVGVLIVISTSVFMLKERVKNRLPQIQKAFVLAFAIMIIILSGAAYARNMVWQSEFDLWNDTLKKSPNKVRALCNFGNANRKIKQNDKAIELYKKGLEINPNSVRVLINLGNAYFDIGEYEQAFQAYIKAQQIDPEYYLTYFNLGVMFKKMGKYSDAIEQYKRAISLKADIIDSYEGLAAVYEKLNKKAEAIDIYNRLIIIKPDHVDAYNSLGILYAEAENYDKAIEVYFKAIRIEPSNSMVYNNIGLVYVQIGNYEQAIDAFEKSINYDPSNADAYNNLGSVYLTTGHYRKAIDVLVQVLQIKPDFVLAHYNLGRAYIGVGDSKAALNQYEILKGIDMKVAADLLSIMRQ